MATTELDALDVRIMQQLQIDGRMPFTRIAKKVGVSEATVRARVGRLTRRRMVRFVTDIDAGDLGLVEAYLGVRVQGPALDRAIEAITAVPEIPYAAACSGPYDILCEVVCRDNDDLLRLLMEIRRAPGVWSIDTITVLKIHKDDWRYEALLPRA